MNLNQITLTTRNFDKSVAFYQKLGLCLIVSVQGAYARFECPVGGSTLSLHQSDTPPGATVVYFEVEDLDKTHAELSSQGIRFDTVPTDQPWLWREARLTDPAGTQLCLFHAGETRRFPPWRLGEVRSPDP